MTMSNDPTNSGSNTACPTLRIEHALELPPSSERDRCYKQAIIALSLGSRQSDYLDGDVLGSCIHSLYQTSLQGQVLWHACCLFVQRTSRSPRATLTLMGRCANIAWELTYGFVHPLSPIETIAAVPWLVIDLGIAHTILKFGPAEWASSPTAQQHLPAMLIAGSTLMYAWLQSFTASCATAGEAAFSSGFLCQVFLGFVSVAQLLSRDSTRGHSMSIW